MAAQWVRHHLRSGARRVYLFDQLPAGHADSLRSTLRETSDPRVVLRRMEPWSPIARDAPTRIYDQLVALVMCIFAARREGVAWVLHSDLDEYAHVGAPPTPAAPPKALIDGIEGQAARQGAEMIHRASRATAPSNNASSERLGNRCEAEGGVPPAGVVLLRRTQPHSTTDDPSRAVDWLGRGQAGVDWLSTNWDTNVKTAFHAFRLSPGADGFSVHRPYVRDPRRLCYADRDRSRGLNHLVDAFGERSDRLVEMGGQNAATRTEFGGAPWLGSPPGPPSGGAPRSGGRRPARRHSSAPPAPDPTPYAGGEDGEVPADPDAGRRVEWRGADLSFELEGDCGGPCPQTRPAPALS
eukprot:gene13510-17931_t